jgi:drug/metabolite transporter superfamily protein YnfA
MLIETEREDNHLWWFFFATITLCLIIGWLLTENHEHEASTCREKGGVYVATQYEKLCLKKTSVIQ